MVENKLESVEHDGQCQGQCSCQMIDEPQCCNVVEMTEEEFKKQFDEVYEQIHKTEQQVTTQVDIEKNKILGKPTGEQVKTVFMECRSIFWKKLQDYGSSWRILRPRSVTDQIAIKAERIRNIEEIGTHLIDDNIFNEFQSIVNYGIIALIQLELNYSDEDDLKPEQAISLYDKYYTYAQDLLVNKNHDYSEAWRRMRVSSYTDFILVKLNRIKGIENNNGKTIISEGIDSNYLDIINYAIFGLIKLTEEEEKKN